MKTFEIGIIAYLAGDTTLRSAVERSWNAIAGSDTGKRAGIAVFRNMGAHGNGEAMQLLKKGSRKWLKALGRKDPASVETLAEFITMGMTSIPAKKYLLFLGGHSDGFLGLLEDEDAGHEMTVAGLAESLCRARQRTGRPVDVLLFNSCWMNMVEVVHEISGFCSVVVGTQEALAGEGIPLENVAAGICERADTYGEMSTGEIVSALFRAIPSFPIHPERSMEDMFTPHFSAIEVAGIQRLKQALDALSCEILTLSRPDVAGFLSILRETRHFGNRAFAGEPYISFKDIFHLCRGIVLHRTLPRELKVSAGRVACEVELMVTGQTCGRLESENSYGISLFLPSEVQDRTTLSLYEGLRWARETRWAKVFEKLRECKP